VTIAGVGVAGYNGTFTVASVPTTTSFTYTSTTSDLASSGGGTISSDAIDPQARARLRAFFARGGGYIGTSVSGTNFTFLNPSGMNLVEGSLLQTSDSAGGGIALWDNVAGAASPITGGYPSRDTLYLPSNVTFFSSVPTGSVVDGRYLATTDATWVAGLWRDRDPNAANAPVIVHGTTNSVARYMGLATNPFSRQDAEREWTMIGQAALWTTLTDEADSNVVSPAPGGEYGHGKLAAACTGAATICGTASGAPGPAIAPSRSPSSR
jgi:hypothetical protein